MTRLGGNNCYGPLQNGSDEDVALANPAVGANWTFTIPADGYTYQPACIYFFFDADATVANRVFWIRITRGGALIARFGRGTNVTASALINFTFFPGSTGQLFDNNGQDGLPGEIRLYAGDIIESVVTNLQAGDALQNIRLQFRTWRTNP